MDRKNVISEVLVISNDDAETQLKDIADVELYTFEKIKNLNDEIKIGNLTFFRITPAVGVEIVSVCSEVIIKKI